MSVPVDFSLDDFLPYKLVRTAEHVSDGLARLYQEEFGITRPEWRVLATLGNRDGVKAKELSAETSLDKVRVSRTLTSLESKGYVCRVKDQNDHRAAYLHLTTKGRELYQRIVPRALEWENDILAGMSASQYRDLFKALDLLLARADKMSLSAREEVMTDQ
ncbi:MarR family winged helix-turn-helix transcriptional regulator [Veronia pacifica]|uniref:MarR family transcriptional regulator n=1 Tax=Veronia pacifica TaxID=1080227 RepID=A0A1C3EC08_9GAMM|nr:MarR family transcriptional regulator [Veronia pacifica]ODA30773.1 MarR family transcriptional regulator [Veronia pacifica]